MNSSPCTVQSTSRKPLKPEGASVFVSSSCSLSQNQDGSQSLGEEYHDRPPAPICREDMIPARNVLLGSSRTFGPPVSIISATTCRRYKNGKLKPYSVLQAGTRSQQQGDGCRSNDTVSKLRLTKIQGQSKPLRQESCLALFVPALAAPRPHPAHAGSRAADEF